MTNMIEQARAVVRASDARVAALVGAAGLSLAEWRLLQALHAAGAVAPSRLADALGLTRGGTTKLIDRLRARRLLVRAAAGRSDLRYQTIALTGAGAVLVQSLLPAATAAARPSGDERADLTVALDALAGQER